MQLRSHSSVGEDLPECSLERALDYGFPPVAGKTVCRGDAGPCHEGPHCRSDEGLLANAAPDRRHLRFAGAVTAARKPSLGTYEVPAVGNGWKRRAAAVETGSL